MEAERVREGILGSGNLLPMSKISKVSITVMLIQFGNNGTRMCNRT